MNVVYINSFENNSETSDVDDLEPPPKRRRGPNRAWRKTSEFQSSKEAEETMNQKHLWKKCDSHETEEGRRITYRCTAGAYRKNECPAGTQQQEDIDESLYSRQLYVLGHEAMRRMAGSDVLISGLGGLGVEIAKNVILGGVKTVTLHDEHVCSMMDLSSQFFLEESDIGKNRAEACLKKLSDLNSHVKIYLYSGQLSEKKVKQFSVIVLTDTTLGEQLRISRITHENNIPLIIGDTRGVFAQIFCDFGEKFTVIDINGENPISTMINDITKDEEGVVTTLDETRHGLEDGDYVTFSEVIGMEELNESSPRQIKVLGPYTFSIGNTSAYNNYVRGGIVTQVKMPKIVQFKDLRESMNAPEYLISDFGKFDRPNKLHLAFLTLHRFVDQFYRVPSPWSKLDADRFVSFAKQINEERESKLDLDEDLLRQFSSVAAGNLSPLNAAVGGVIAQEVMKACSGKFNPIYQWLYFDATESLPDDGVDEEDAAPAGNRYDGQVAIFGKQFQKTLGSLRYFIVGSGAIGCEVLKNFAMMGVGAVDGNIIITDMDLIERSNLNRQFLFRSQDIQQSKSSTAARAVRKMNPDVRVEAHENRVGPETEDVYDDTFFENLDGVANALDNVAARTYMDQRCVYFAKPLLESGTLGTKGNTQVVVPYLTESYSSSRDPPEKSIPLCTLKNFPNAIEHTLQWARDTFEGLFIQAPGSAAQYLQDPNFIEQTIKLEDPEKLEILKIVKSVLVDERPFSFEDCVTWARNHFEDQYNNQIMQLLFNFPPDHQTTTGQPFWSGPKRCPKPIQFNANEPLHLDYIVAAANLKAEVYGLPQNRNRDQIKELVARIVVPQFTPKSGVVIAVQDSDIKKSGSKEGNEERSNEISKVGDSSIRSSEYVKSSEVHLNQILKVLPSRDDLKDLKIKALQFEKDDDTNMHIDFIVAASNLRATNYSIPTANRHQSKLIAGKIIPAIATTTSVVSGFVSLELIKLAQGRRELKAFKNGFINLALPFFGFSEPLEPAKHKYYDIEWSLWDRFEIYGELTVDEFLEFFLEKHKLEVTMITYDVMMVYADFMPKLIQPEWKKLPIIKAIETILREKLKPHVKAIPLIITCNELHENDDSDENENDVEVPYVKYNVPKCFRSKW